MFYVNFLFQISPKPKHETSACKQTANWPSYIHRLRRWNWKWLKMLSWHIWKHPNPSCCVPAKRPDQTEETCTALPLCLRVYCKHRIMSQIPEGQATNKQTGESGLTGWKTVEAGCRRFLVVWLLSERQHRTTSEGLWFGELTVDQTSLICSRRPPVFVFLWLPEVPATVRWTHFITAVRDLSAFIVSKWNQVEHEFTVWLNAQLFPTCATL